ncbi:hypothetical protein BDZ91DRAFT_637671, partial [Kalaharituber pfeilii]
PLNILLTNGRFPVTIDLARQLSRAGHTVYAVDPMHYHVCKFSNAVRKSWWVPTPHVDGRGYVEGVLKSSFGSALPGGSGRIDLVIPMHEEIFYLAEACWFALAQLRTRLLAPSFPTLIMLHNKHSFSEFLYLLKLDCPRYRHCLNKTSIAALIDGTAPLDPAAPTSSIALKPVFGRACSNVYHLTPSSVSKRHAEKNKKMLEEIDVSSDNHYIAQEWITGDRYCTYAIVRGGRIRAFGCYPVRDTIDGSSCVYFEAVEHPRIRAYVERIAGALGDVGGPGFHIALDMIEQVLDEGGNGRERRTGRLVAIECNPRATSGIHLFSGTTQLAKVLTDLESKEQVVAALPGMKRQLAPGMLMYRSTPASNAPLPPKSEVGTYGRFKAWCKRGYSIMRQYMEHMGRLMGSKDVMFSKGDLVPSLMQPFLLTSYYEICRERKMNLPEMFQWDLTWEPRGESVERARKVVGEE